MELTQLRYFQTAAYYQHISRAAEELNISQPALSTMISRLEKELGVPLFDHNGRSIILNQNGQRFLQRVNHILMEVENSKRELQDIADEGDNSISLAVSSSQFLQGMHAFMYQHPNYKWNQRVAENKEIAALLNRGQIDLAVTPPGIYGEVFESTLLLRDIFKLAVTAEKCPSGGAHRPALHHASEGTALPRSDRPDLCRPGHHAPLHHGVRPSAPAGADQRQRRRHHRFPVCLLSASVQREYSFSGYRGRISHP